MGGDIVSLILTSLDKFDDFLKKSIDSAVVENKPIFIMGDINLNLFQAHVEKRLTDSTIPYGLKLLNSITPTRCQGNSRTLIDHMFTDKEGKHECYISDAPFDTDHFMTTTILDTIIEKKKETKHYTILDKKNYNQEKFIQDVSLTDFSPIYRQKNCQSAFRSFEFMLWQLIKKHAPLTRKFTRRKKPLNFLPTNNLKELSTKKKELLKIYDRTGAEDDHKAYKAARNTLNNALKNQQ